MIVGMIDKDFEMDMESIEEIMQFVSRYGLEFEVQETAKLYMDQNPELHLVQAYWYAAADWDCF